MGTNMKKGEGKRSERKKIRIHSGWVGGKEKAEVRSRRNEFCAGIHIHFSSYVCVCVYRRASRPMHHLDSLELGTLETDGERYVLAYNGHVYRVTQKWPRRRKRCYSQLVGTMRWLTVIYHAFASRRLERIVNHVVGHTVK